MDERRDGQFTIYYATNRHLGLMHNTLADRHITSNSPNHDIDVKYHLAPPILCRQQPFNSLLNNHLVRVAHELTSINPAHNNQT